MQTKGIAIVVLFFSLGTALALAVSGQEENNSGVVGAVERTFSPSTQDKTVSDIHFDLSAIKRTVPDQIQTTGLFQSRTWYVPPPLPPPSARGIAYCCSGCAAAANVVPPPPSAPPMPFIFVGRMIDGNEVVLFLTRSNTPYIARTNDVLDGSYRVGKIGDDNAELTYLPMNIQQTLAFNSTAIGVHVLAASPSTQATVVALQTDLPISGRD